MPITREPLIAHVQGRKCCWRLSGSPGNRPNGSPSSTYTRVCSPETNSPFIYRGPTASKSGDASRPCSIAGPRPGRSPTIESPTAGSSVASSASRSTGSWRSPPSVTGGRPRLKSPGGDCYRSISYSIIRSWLSWGPSGSSSLASNSSGSSHGCCPAGSTPAKPRNGSSISPSGCRLPWGGGGRIRLHRSRHGNPYLAPLVGRSPPRALAGAPQVGLVDRGGCGCLGAAPAGPRRACFSFLAQAGHQRHRERNPKPPVGRR